MNDLVQYKDEQKVLEETRRQQRAQEKMNELVKKAEDNKRRTDEIVNRLHAKRLARMRAEEPVHEVTAKLAKLGRILFPVYLLLFVFMIFSATN